MTYKTKENTKNQVIDESFLAIDFVQDTTLKSMEKSKWTLRSTIHKYSVKLMKKTPQGASDRR